MSSLIDSSNYNSFPNEFIKEIVNRVNSMPIKDQSELLNLYDPNVVDNYFRPLGNSFDWYQNSLIPLMNNYDFICFHSTRVYSEKDILDNGLKTNDWNSYSTTMANTLSLLNVPNDKNRLALNYIKTEYDRKITNQPELCFFSGLNLISQDCVAGYENWCESIGGELASWSLENNMPEIYSMLKNNGNPYYVNFKLRFEKFCNYCKDFILKELLTKVICEEFWKIDYEVRFDGKTGCDIPASDILQLIPCDFNFQ